MDMGCSAIVGHVSEFRAAAKGFHGLSQNFLVVCIGKNLPNLITTKRLSYFLKYFIFSNWRQRIRSFLSAAMRPLQVFTVRASHSHPVHTDKNANIGCIWQQKNSFTSGYLCT